MLDSFKAILEKEREAENILIAARKKAKKIEDDAQDKTKLVYSKIFQETILEAKRKAIEIKEYAKNDAEAEAKIFVERAENLKKKLVASAKKNFNDAVDIVLEEILS